MFSKIFGGWKKMRSAIDRIDRNLDKLVSLPGYLDAIENEESKLGKRLARMDFQLKFQLDSLQINMQRIEHHMALSDPRFADPLRLERYGRRVYSQNDEDGVIFEIFRRIGEGKRTFVEIAAGDGKENCTAALLLHGWGGLWVECDPPNVASIKQEHEATLASGRLKLNSDYVKTSTINQLIRSTVGEEIDLLVIDIDGNDYYLVEALEVRPRVLCIEVQSFYPPPIRYVMPRDDENAEVIGNPMRATSASLQAYEELLTPMGYSLVGTTIAGVNCFFVRGDLVEGKFQAPFTAYNHYNPARYWFQNYAFKTTIWRGPPDGVAPPKG